MGEGRKPTEEELQRAYDRLAEAQAQLIQAERLSALGELAAGMAHNFNNLLVGMLGSASLILLDPEDPEAVRGNAQIIVDSAQKAAQVIHGIQTGLYDFKMGMYPCPIFEGSDRR